MATIRSSLAANGIRRLGTIRSGFRYRTADGSTVSAADARRIGSLAIPPGWAEVRIAASAESKVQAIGRDAAGRWQYRYHTSHTGRQARTKYDRLLAFGRSLPDLRRALARDLARRGLPREKALACAVSVLTACFLRPGGEVYARENGSYGLATLQKRHVRVRGSRIAFDFCGKHGQRQRHEVWSPVLARIVADMLRMPGAEVFQYVDEHGRPRDVRRQHINDYLRRCMGAYFSARVFRTWGGTLLCAGALATSGGHRPRNARERKSAILAAVRHTAVQLGNTAAACRRSYVHPGVIAAFAAGRTVKVGLTRPEALLDSGRAGLDASERALLALLDGAGAPAARGRRNSTK